MKNTPIAAILIASTASALSAQQFDGLYHPNFGENRSWQCTADYVGSDGGAMQILSNELLDVETRCNLHDEQQLGDTGIYQYSASCSSEGTVFRQNIFVAAYDQGILIANGNGITDWRSCDSRTDEQDLSLTLGPNRFLGMQLDYDTVIGYDLVPIYGYVHSLCRGVIPSWPEQVAESGCALRDAIWHALEGKGWYFDQSEQEWALGTHDCSLIHREQVMLDRPCVVIAETQGSEIVHFDVYGNNLIHLNIAATGQSGWNGGSGYRVTVPIGVMLPVGNNCYASETTTVCYAERLAQTRLE